MSPPFAVCYAADSKTGRPLDDSRGCSNSYLVLRARELWPDLAAQWYAAYEQHFWQRDRLAVGFRELPRIPGVVWIVAIVQLGFGAALLRLAWRLLRPRSRRTGRSVTTVAQ